MKILTVLTGGTIGSKVNDNVMDVKDHICPVVELYKENSAFLFHRVFYKKTSPRL